ncbi:hypothetical protein [Streptomyces rimosus]
MYYDAATHGNVKAFRRTPAFPRFRKQCEEAAASIAACAMAEDPNHPLPRAIEALVDDIFGVEFYGPRARFQPHLELAYTVVKPALERIAARLKDPRVGMPLRTRVMLGLADSVPKCGPGAINGIAMAAHKLDLACDSSLAGRARSIFHEVMTEQLLRLVLRQGHDGWDTHRFQACLNALSEWLGQPVVNDPFVAGRPLEASDRQALAALTEPSELARLTGAMLARLADEYIEALRRRIDAQHPLWSGQAISESAVAADIVPLLEDDALLRDFGPIELGSLLRELGPDEPGGAYQLCPDRSLLQWNLARTLRDVGVLSGVNSDMLRQWSEPPLHPGGRPRDMQLHRFADFFWIESLHDDHAARLLEPGDLCHLYEGMRMLAGRFDARGFLRHAGNLLRRADAVPDGYIVNALGDCVAAVAEGAEADTAEADGLDSIIEALKRWPQAFTQFQQRLVAAMAAGEPAPSSAARGWLPLAQRYRLPLLAFAAQRRCAPEGDWQDVRRNPGRSPLLQAAKMGDVAMLAGLMAAGAHLTPVAAEAIEVARRSGHPAAADFVQATLDAQVQTIAAIRAGRLDAVQAALPDTPGPHFRDPSGNPPLKHAIETGQYAIAAWLIEQGADPKATTAGGVSLLSLAIARGDIAMAGLLLQHAVRDAGPRLHAMLDDGIRAACQAPDDVAAELCRLLLAVSPAWVASRQQGRLPWQALETAIRTGRHKLLAFLIQSPLAVAARWQYSGESLLHQASTLADPESAYHLTRILFDAGCRWVPDGRLANASMGAAIRSRNVRLWTMMLPHFSQAQRIDALTAVWRLDPCTPLLVPILDTLSLERAGSWPEASIDAILDSAMVAGGGDRLTAWLAHPPFAKAYPAWLPAAWQRAISADNSRMMERLLALPPRDGISASAAIPWDWLRNAANAVFASRLVACLWQRRGALDHDGAAALEELAFRVREIDWVQQHAATQQAADRALMAVLAGQHRDVQVLRMLSWPQLKPRAHHLVMALRSDRNELAKAIWRRLDEQDRAKVLQELPGMIREDYRADNGDWRPLARWWVGQGHNADIPVDHPGGTTLLIAAAECGDAELVRSCLEHGGSLLAPLADGRTALDVVAAEGSPEVTAAVVAGMKADRIGAIVARGAGQIRALITCLQRVEAMHAFDPQRRDAQAQRDALVVSLVDCLSSGPRTAARRLIEPLAPHLLALALCCPPAVVDWLEKATGISVRGKAGQRLLRDAASAGDWPRIIKALRAGAQWHDLREARELLGKAIVDNAVDVGRDMELLLGKLRETARARNPFIRLIAFLRHGRDAWINAPLASGETLLSLAGRGRREGWLSQLRQAGAADKVRMVVLVSA